MSGTGCVEFQGQGGCSLKGFKPESSLGQLLKPWRPHVAEITLIEQSLGYMMLSLEVFTLNGKTRKR